MSQKTFCLIVLLISANRMTGCINPPLQPNEYMQYVTDSANGLQKTIVHRTVYFSVQYEPLDYVCLLEKSGKVNINELKELRTEFDGLFHFNFSIASNDHRSDPLRLSDFGMEYEEVLYSLAFQADKDFQIIYGTDTLPCVVHHFECTHGLRSRVELVLGFREKSFTENDSDDHIVFQFNDHVFGSGTNEFVFKKSDFIDLPALKLTSL